MASPYYRGGHNQNASGPMHRSNNSGSSLGGGRDKVADTNVTLMELENNQRWAELGDQVELLKGLSLDINQEVKSQNSLLDGMGASFGSTTQMFKSTMGKLGTMLQAGGSNHMIYLIVFVVFVFLVLYFLMSRK
jgi:hypothetical protein